MKNLLTLIVLCIGLLSNASPKPKDTIYTNVGALMKEVRTTKKKTATYYLVLKEDDKEVKVRIDLKAMEADIPFYKSSTFDIEKLMALKEEGLEEPKQKFTEFKAKLEEWKNVNSQVKALKAEIKSLRSGDSLTWDNVAIDSIQEVLDEKNMEKSQRYEAYEATFSEYEKMIDDMLGGLKHQYRKRLSSAIEEAYHKLENTETIFLTLQDAPTWHDVWINLIKLDARRPMKIDYVARGAKNVTENISPGKIFYIIHYAQIGVLFGDQVQPVIDDLKKKEIKINPYLLNERFALVCDDQDRTEHYINSVVDPWGYDSEEEEDRPKPGDPLVNMEIVHNYSAPNFGGKFGCSRVGSGCEESSIPNMPKFGDNEKVHGGVDLYAPLNTKVYAMFDGIVQRVVDGVPPNTKGALGKLGNRILIKSNSRQHKKNPSTIYIYYTHLNKLEKLKVGDSITQGQLIGETGKTGNAHNIPIWRYHTHIVVYEGDSKGSNRVNPTNYFTTQNLTDKNN